MKTEELTFDQLEAKVLNWSYARGIIQNSPPVSQLLKAFEEMGEVAAGEAKGKPALIEDGIGDVLVCLINYAELRGMNLTKCLAHAYDQIKDRKGRMQPNGVFLKEDDEQGAG